MRGKNVLSTCCQSSWTDIDMMETFFFFFFFFFKEKEKKN